jgi:YebC/PmpR family DNA-binding regulatory protein
MSGHSKWSTIKHKKEKTDAQRGKVFTKIGRELAIAVREGGSDPNVNGKLRDVVAKAKANNMPNDNISRSIKKAAGEMGNVSYEENDYEGYGVGGVAVIVHCISDNRNRTVSEVRHAFDKHGGSLGSSGCVSYMFDRKGILIIEKAGWGEDEVMMDAIEAGADDVQVLEDAFEIATDANNFSAVREALDGKYEFVSAEIELVPQNTVIPEGENMEKILKMIDMLEDLDDVQEVWHNADFPDEEAG